MKCISSPALEDIEIARYVDGEADETIVAHIYECPFCSERSRQWTLLQNRLRKQFYRTTCPTPTELGDHHLGLLPAPQALMVAQHLRECPLCRRELAQLQEFLAEPEAKPGLLDTAKILFAQLVGAGVTPAFGALRGEDKGPLTFEADGMVIVLDIQPAAHQHVSMLGQVAADEQDQWTGAVVELSQADSTEKMASLDEFGAFRFDDIHPGATQLSIRSLHGIIVHIMNIEISI